MGLTVQGGSWFSVFSCYDARLRQLGVNIGLVNKWHANAVAWLEGPSLFREYSRATKPYTLKGIHRDALYGLGLRVFSCQLQVSKLSEGCRKVPVMNFSPNQGPDSPLGRSWLRTCLSKTPCGIRQGKVQDGFYKYAL